MPKLLLHVCCAPCACYPVERLKDKFDITLFFYNPNIYPEKEYKQRLEEIKRFSQSEKISLIEGSYDDKHWFKLTNGLEKEPERGRRCDICYEMRMGKTAEYAKANGYDFFGTDLSISPHKKADVINQIGEKLEKEFGVKYFEADFKKKDGFKKSLELSHRHNFYRQNYCGCVYSKREGNKENHNVK